MIKIKTKEVRDFPNYYITDCGQVISKRSNKPLSTWIDNTGYYQCILYKQGKRHYKRVHRLMGENLIANNEDDLKLEVNHIDGNKLNNHIFNLELVSGDVNTQHGYDQGLYKTNKRNISIKVYSKENGQLVGLYKSIRQASERLKLNRKTISAIVFNNKINNYDYIFKPIIEEDFYYIQIFDKNNNYINTVPSIIQTSDITKLDRHKISRIIQGEINNNTNYIFKKQYKNENKQWSQETIESTIAK